MDGDDPVAATRAIISDVREYGDSALRRLTAQFDGVELDSIVVAPSAIAEALDRISPEVRAALEFAHERVVEFHRHQLNAPTEFVAGGTVVQSFARPVRRAGCYVPGGRACYPSTVLMTVVPAKVAGVDEVVVCVPPDRNTGVVAEVTLAACAIAGADAVYQIGGAQAIAALAYGTDSIPPVDVICGPGNRYVAIAKREVAGTVGIASSFAGPSEVVVIADESADPTFAAADVLVQAEHGPDGAVWLLCWQPEVYEAVCAEIERLAGQAQRHADISSTLATGGYAVLCRDRDQAIEVSNEIAPEHLQLMMSDADAVIEDITNAGAIFVGNWAPAAFGDYAAGPSHVLPTYGSARFSSALTVSDFQRTHHVVRVDRDAAQLMAPHVVALAGVEGLAMHQLAAQLRLDTAEVSP